MSGTSQAGGPGQALAARAVEAIVIGGSAGAIDALLGLLPVLPRDLRVPILAVVHLPQTGSSPLPLLFAASCPFRVAEAIDKQQIEPGVVLFAPSDCHLLVERDRTVALSMDEPVHYSRPSIDVLFESAAWVWGARLVGILLSGASADGAAGLAAIAAAGGLAWVQEPESAMARVMPLAGLSATPAARALSISGMGSALSLLSGAVGSHA